MRKINLLICFCIYAGFPVFAQDLQEKNGVNYVINKPIQLPLYSMFEFRIKTKEVIENPYKEVLLVGEFNSPIGKKIVIEGYYDGNNDWKIRFSPTETGVWTYELKGKNLGIYQQGNFKCAGSKKHGFIGIHPQNPYAFAYANGTPFFPMGDTNYGLYDDSSISPVLREKYLDTRRKQNFNFVRMEVGHSHARAKANPKFWAWGGTPQAPDLDRLNPDFFVGLDSLFFQMRDKGMNAELILLNFYRLPFTDTKLWTPEREKIWLRYLIARYAAMENIFMWTLSNEYETHPDGVYRLDNLADVKWAIEIAQFVKTHDLYLHPFTVHPVVSSSTKGASPRAGFELPWRIGGFFGKEPAVGVLSQQTGQTGIGVVWSDTCQCWNGNDPELTNSISIDRVYNKPVINTENGYEFLTGYPTMRKQVHHTDKVRRSSWRIVCAGGYFAAGFSGTIGHNDIWNVIDPTNHYTFEVRDEGVGAQLGILYQFFSKLPYWKMQPYTKLKGDAIALAEEGKVYVVYLPHGGSVNLEYPFKKPLEARWFNPRTGEMGKTLTIPEQSKLNFVAPDKNDWVLLLEVLKGK
jgi:hypothetical protein